MSGPVRDLFHAWRGLSQKPGFLVASLLTPAIGIGANVTIFSLVNGLSLRPMPFGERTNRLVTIHPTHRFELSQPGWGDAEISYADLLDFRQATSAEGIGAYLLRNFVLSGDGAQHQRGCVVEAGCDDRAVSVGAVSDRPAAGRALPDHESRVWGAVVPIRRSYVDSGVDRMGIILMTAVGFVLLIMCANLANLMLVRGASRQRELAVRSAMGAGRARLLWASLSESVLLAAPGTLLGLIASQWAIDWMISSFPEELPYWFTFGLDWRVALFTIGIAAFTTIVVGLLPSIRAAKPDLVNDLKEAGRGLSLGRGGHRLQATLAVSQVALCFGLLVGANLMVQSFLAMQRADLGFDHRPILSARGYLAGDAYDDINARVAFYQNVVTTLSALPGATAAAIRTGRPESPGERRHPESRAGPAAMARLEPARSPGRIPVR